MSILDRAKAPQQKPVKTKAEAHEGFLKVFDTLAAAKVRVTYTGAGVIALAFKMIGAHELGRPSSFRVINMLPLEQQCLVTKADGSYKDSTVSKWAKEALEGYESFAILPDTDVEALVNEVMAS